MKSKTYVIIVFFLVGCGPSEKEVRLERELAELKQQAQNFELIKIKQIELENEIKNLKSQQLERELIDIKKKQEKITVNGNIFLVTKSAENIKFGLVQVSATPIDLFNAEHNKLIQSLNDDYEQKQDVFRKVFQEYIHQGNVYATKQLNYAKQLSITIQKIGEKSNSEDYILFPLSSSDNEIIVKFGRERHAAESVASEINELISNLNKIRDEMFLDYGKMNAKSHALESLKDTKENIINRKIRVLVQSLSTRGTSATSDADGKFTFKLERNQRYMLSGFGNRSVSGVEEQYNWIKPLDLKTDGSEISVLISNDSLETNIVGAEEMLEKINKLSYDPPENNIPSNLRPYQVKTR